MLWTRSGIVGIAITLSCLPQSISKRIGAHSRIKSRTQASAHNAELPIRRLLLGEILALLFDRRPHLPSLHLCPPDKLSLSVKKLCNHNLK